RAPELLPAHQLDNYIDVVRAYDLCWIVTEQRPIDAARLFDIANDRALKNDLGARGGRQQLTTLNQGTHHRAANGSYAQQSNSNPMHCTLLVAQDYGMSAGPS
ncbi:MAG: hypothetical protein H7Z43_02085, partial [Clostridia bacterium]|nr:hypothetical protein [Deltaproteobacteria bacterium]